MSGANAAEEEVDTADRGAESIGAAATLSSPTCAAASLSSPIAIHNGAEARPHEVGRALGRRDAQSAGLE